MSDIQIQLTSREADLIFRLLHADQEKSRSEAARSDDEGFRRMRQSRADELHAIQAKIVHATCEARAEDEEAK